MSTTTPLPPVTEASAWLRGTAGAQLRRIARLGLDPHGVAGPAIVAPLVGRITTPGTEDDRRCDRCGRHVDASGRYFVGIYVPAPGVRLVVGLCAEHARAEGVTA